MNKLCILIFVFVFLIIIGSVFITREGFDDSQATSSSSAKEDPCSIFEKCKKIDVSQEDKSSQKKDEICKKGNAKCEFDENTGICGVNKELKDSDCSEIETKEKEKKDKPNIQTVFNVCPENPDCVGICLNQFTWTEENMKDYYFDDLEEQQDFVGRLKTLNKDKEKTKNLIVTSQCYKCIKNFYPILNLLHENKCVATQ